MAGFIAGFVAGLLVMLYAFVVGSISAQGIDLRTYLSLLSPESIVYFVFGKSTLVGGLIHLGLSSGSALLGASAAVGADRSKHKMAEWRASFKQWSQHSWFGKLKTNVYVGYVLMGVVLFLLVLLPRTWGSYWNYIMGTVGIYILLGIGLNIIVGFSGQLVLGYVAFFAIGAYSFALITAPEPHHIEMNFWLALVVAVIASAISGVLIGLPIMRLRGDYLAIVTLGFGEIIRILIKSDWLKDITLGPRGVRNIAGPTLFGKSFSTDVDYMYLIILAVLLSIFLAKRWQESHVGRSWLAISQDETVAQATGVDTYKYKLLALAIGAAFAGLGGALFASRNQFTGPEDHALMVSINVLCLVIVGGMGGIPGVILGAFALKGLPEILRELESYRMLVFGALLVVMMIIRPEGLWPARRPRLEVKPAPGADEKQAEPAAQGGEV
jgi:branched-chain amino acid transport system permease protein